MVSSPALITYLSVPGGPMQILDIMLQERLLQLEGQRLGIEAEENAVNNPQAYSRQVYDTLIEPCPEPDDEAVSQG